MAFEQVGIFTSHTFCDTVFGFFLLFHPRAYKTGNQFLSPPIFFRYLRFLKTSLVGQEENLNKIPFWKQL